MDDIHINYIRAKMGKKLTVSQTESGESAMFSQKKTALSGNKSFSNTKYIQMAKSQMQAGAQKWFWGLWYDFHH